jgi:hypothetical protein
VYFDAAAEAATVVFFKYVVCRAESIPLQKILARDGWDLADACTIFPDRVADGRSAGWRTEDWKWETTADSRG